MADEKRDDIDWERLDRFVRGEGDPAERAMLEQWVNADPERRALAKAMRTVGSRRGTPPDAQRALREMQRRLGMSAPRPTPIRPLPRRHVPERRTAPRTLWLSAAAAAVVLAATLAVWQREKGLDGSGGSARAESKAATRELRTAPGQRASFQLADGSLVRLSADSRLTVPGDLGTARNRMREVTLVGEAFFTVKHDSTRPFSVRTAYGTANDLGTEFAVNTYPEMHGMRLAVREGRVAIRPDADTSSAVPRTGADSGLVAILEKGDVARVNANGGIAIDRRQNMATFFAGADGTLALQDVTLREAIPMLERWFNVKIQVDDRALLARRVSGTFRDEAAHAAIDVIALALERKATWDGNVVRLRARSDGDGLR